MSYSVSNAVAEGTSSYRSGYNNLYFEIFKDFAEGNHANLRPADMYNFNFCKNVLLDREANIGNTKANFAVQGANPTRMCRKLEKELCGANYEFSAKNDYNVSRYYIDEMSAPNIQETLKCEEVLWQLISEFITADYVFFEHKKDEPLHESDRTPFSLLTEIIKGDHELLSCHYLLKWLEKINVNSMYRQFENKREEFQNHLNQENHNLHNETARYLYHCLRAGKLGNAHEEFPNIVKAWKISMLQGVTSSFDNIIDPISADNSAESTNSFELAEYVENPRCYYNNSDWFLQLKIARQKSESVDGNNSYENALYG